MTESQPWSRPEPERMEPRRDGWSSANHLQQASEVAATTVEQAVNLSYQVIEDNIARGKFFAGQRKRNADNSYGSGDSNGNGASAETQDMAMRLIELGREFTNAYFDLVEQALLGGGMGIGRGRSRRRRGRGRPEER